MNKYSCFFLNKKIEDLYQQTHQIQQRIFQFRLFSYSLTAALIFKIVMMIVLGKVDNLYPHISMLFIILIYNVVKVQNSQKLRLVQSAINMIFTLYVLQYDVFTDQITQNYNGGNQMTANILNSIMGEFPEAAIGTIITLGMRLYFFFRFGDLNNLEVMLITTALHIVWVYYLYNFNKAKRSQFILTLVDNKWEKIFQYILNNNRQFVLLHYDEEHFKIKKVLQTILPQITSQEFFFEYIHSAKCNNKPIQDYFYQQINQNKKNQQDVINQQILVRYQKKLIKFNFSLFFGNQPIILLVKEDQIGTNNDVLVQQTIILKLLKHLVNIIECNKQYNKKKFFQLSQFINIKYVLGKVISQNKSVKQINLNEYINKIAQKYKCYLNIQTYGLDFIIKTQVDVFRLFLLIIFGNTNKKCIQILFYRDFDYKVHLVFEGYFKQDTISLLYKKLEFYFALIIRKISIKQDCIITELNDEILCPFINIF